MEEKLTRDSVIEICRELDAQKLATGNMKPLSGQDLLNAPDTNLTRYMVADHISWDELQQELGRVTTSLAMEWLYDEWWDNAQWIKDILAEKDIELLTAPLITSLGKAGLMPKRQVIEEVWGGIFHYRYAMDIEPYPIRVEANTWDKPQFETNGREYAGHLGRKFGFPLMPKQKDLRKSSRDGRTPTVDQILDEYDDGIEEYQAGIGFVNLYAVRHWTDQQWKDNFDWLIDVWKEHDREVTSVEELLKVAGRLKIGPSPEMARERWDTVTNYARRMGRESAHAKRFLSDEGVVRAGIGIVGRKKGPIRPEDFDDNPNISMQMCLNRFGGLAALNFKLGFITAYWECDKNMLLWWGTTAFMPEAERLPKRQDLKDRQKQYQAPSIDVVLREFDRSIDTFRQELLEANTWIEQQISRLASTRLSSGLIRQAMRRNHQLFRPGENIKPEELAIFSGLKAAGVNMQLIAQLMDTGISFGDPRPQLDGLATGLAEKNMLTSSNLRKLEPYMIGLAPHEVNMSWTDFIADYRRRARAT